MKQEEKEEEGEEGVVLMLRRIRKHLKTGKGRKITMMIKRCRGGEEEDEMREEAE